MPFPQVASGRRPLSIFDHMALIAVAALPLAAFLPAARSPYALGLSAVMLVLGYFLWALPGLGVRGRESWFAPLVLPAFMALALVYLVLSFVSFFCDPDATVMVVAAQLTALIYLAVRS